LSNTTIQGLFSSIVINRSELSLNNYLAKISLVGWHVSATLSMTNIKVYDLFCVIEQGNNTWYISFYKGIRISCYNQVILRNFFLKRKELYYEIKRPKSISNLRDKLITSKNVLILMLLEKIHDSLQLPITYSSENNFTTSSEESSVDLGHFTSKVSGVHPWFSCGAY
jgi:hypothetical protein